MYVCGRQAKVLAVQSSAITFIKGGMTSLFSLYIKGFTLYSPIRAFQSITVIFR